MALLFENSMLNDMIAMLIILIAFVLVMQLIKNSDRLILTLIGILMGVMIAKHFPLFVEEVITLIDSGWRTTE